MSQGPRVPSRHFSRLGSPEQMIGDGVPTVQEKISSIRFGELTHKSDESRLPTWYGYLGYFFTGCRPVPLPEYATLTGRLGFCKHMANTPFSSGTDGIL